MPIKIIKREKPLKLEKPVARIVVGVHVIEARRVDVARYDWGHNLSMGLAKERSRLAVTVDGVLRGHLIFPTGWGGEWRALSLWSGEDYERREGDERLYLKPATGFSRETASRDELLAGFPGWIEAGKAPTAEEKEALILEAQADRARRAEKKAADTERWRLEREERERQREVDRQADEARRRDEVEVLEGLLARRAQAALTNREVDVLEAIAARLRN